MGGQQSVDSTKTVESSGQVNNNIIFKAMEGHSMQMTIIIIQNSIICLTSVLELILYVYRSHIKNVKKKCNQGQVRNN